MGFDIEQTVQLLERSPATRRDHRRRTSGQESLIGASALFLALATPIPCQCQVPDSSYARGPDPLRVLVAVGGSAAGGIAGWEFGQWFAQQADVDQGGDDPGVVVAGAGFLVGSTAGVFLATTFIDLPRRSHPSTLRRFRDAAVGAGLGIVGGLAMSKLTGEGQAFTITYSLVQGLYAGLSNGRW